MAPSGVQKERMQPDDMFVLDAKGEILHTPAPKPPPAREPKLSECSPLFMAVRHCNAAAHSLSPHGSDAVLSKLGFACQPRNADVLFVRMSYRHTSSATPVLSSTATASTHSWPPSWTPTPQSSESHVSR